MLLRVVPLLLAFAGLSCARRQTVIQFPAPVGDLQFSSSGAYLISKDDSWAHYWLADVSSSRIVNKDALRFAAVSHDERFAAITNSKDQMKLLDLTLGRLTPTPSSGGCLFSPHGHKVAFKVPAGPKPALGFAITVYDPDSAKSTTLSKYSGDLHYGIYKALNAGLAGWTEHGIEVSAYMTPPTQANPIFFIDPETDRATLSPVGYNGGYGKLVDGGTVGLAPTPNGFGLVRFGPNGREGVLFDPPASAGPPMEVNFRIAADANRMLVWRGPITPGSQSIWLVNTANARSKQLLEAPFDGRHRLAYAISGDGEKIAYQSPDDPNAVVVIDAPRP